MPRRKKKEPEIPIHVLENQAMDELGYKMHKILMEYPEDHHAELRAKLEYQAGQDIHEDYAKTYPAWARVYGGPKKTTPPVSKEQFKPVLGNVWIDKDAEKYD